MYGLIRTIQWHFLLISCIDFSVRVGTVFVRIFSVLAF